MMKRYASHYLYLPGYGFLWHYVVQMHENCVEALFPMSDEIESTEWQPGVIALVPLEADVSALSFNSKDILSEVPVEVDRKSTRLNSSHIPLSRMPSSA